VPSAVRTGEFPKDLWIDFEKRFQWESKELDPAQRVKERSCEQISARGLIGLRQVWYQS
jgi:hypothetical protein